MRKKQHPAGRILIIGWQPVRAIGGTRAAIQVQCGAPLSEAGGLGNQARGVGGWGEVQFPGASGVRRVSCESIEPEFRNPKAEDRIDAAHEIVQPR